MEGRWRKSGGKVKGRVRGHQSSCESIAQKKTK